MNQSESLSNLAQSLARVQGQLRPAEQNAANPFFKSKYADLGSIIASARELMAENGLSISQFPGPTMNGEALHYATLTTILMHESGEWLSQDLTMPLAKVDPQGYGSALTYARRYALASVLGIVTGEDDDGNAATGTTSSTARHDPSVQSTYTAPPPPSEPPPIDGKVADARAWLTDQAKDNQVNFGAVADALGMAGKLNTNGNGNGVRPHFKNWLNTPDCEHIRNGLSERGYAIDMRINIPLKTALYIFDKRVEVQDG